jgi:uncharacterized protein YprB with RNaseH-like and TPR domain
LSIEHSSLSIEHSTVSGRPTGCNGTLPGSLRHFRGIGPVRLQALHDAGIRTWYDILASDHERLHADAQSAIAAFESSDLHWFADTLHPADRWRLLADAFDRATFFDIETDGTEASSQITCIAAWHRGAIHIFVDDELEEFLDLLEDVDLLVSFNGASFDVPRVMDCFRIPELPCPHVDLRWICHHHGLTGGLKSISQKLNCDRPADLDGADGALAVLLWNRWNNYRDEASRDHLLRYCAADVILTRLVAADVARQCGALPTIDADPWRHLPPAPSAPPIQNSPSAPAFNRPRKRHNLPRFFINRR